MDKESKNKQSLGGKARAKSLSSDERANIASRAAAARWKHPVAHYEGDIELGSMKISCAVVEEENSKDISRIISSAGFMRALGRPWKGSYERTGRPNFLEANNLQPFISKDLEGVLEMVEYRTPRGAVKRGYLAEMIPMVCEVYLTARDADELHTSQERIAKACEIIMRGLARVGIMALVDEATGYQEIRDRFALQKILEKYITDEWAKWTKTFPDDFYKHLFRLKELEYPRFDSGRKPSYVGHWTNDIVYSRLAPGVLTVLRTKNPKTPAGNRKRKHHQHLTRDYGHPALREHLSNVVFLMKTCETDEEFKRKLNIASPKYNDTMQFPLES